MKVHNRQPDIAITKIQTPQHSQGMQIVILDCSEL